MKEADEEERLLRRYLLGELDEPEQERVEERFIADSGFKERALMAEDELVEDYLAGRLSEADRELFVGHFLSTPEQRRKVKIAASLERYLTAEKPLPPTEPGGEARPPGVSEPKTGQSPFWRRPAAFVPASLALLLAVALGLVWLSSVRQRRNELAEVRRELERINAQPVSDRSSGEFLSPIAVRGGSEANVLPRPAEGPGVPVWLLLVKDEYQDYRVAFQKDGDAERFTVGGLRAETTPRGRAVLVRLPARLLGSGVYTLTLSGVAGGTAEEINEYSFRVTP